jgi:Na+-driven multidrug efflux pump
LDQDPCSDDTDGLQLRQGSSICSFTNRTSTSKDSKDNYSTANGHAKSSDISLDSSLASRTFLSRLHHDDVSFTEALDQYTIPKVPIPKMDHPQDELGEIDVFWGDRAWWKPKMISSAWDKLVQISDLDDEMIALLRIALPASAQGFLHGLFNLLDVSLIGYLIGTQPASVFVLVSLLTWLPTTLMYGFLEALGKVIPFTIDQCNPKLAGVFLFMAMFTFSLAMALIGLFWTFTMKMMFLRIGFDDNTALLAEQFVSVQIALEWITGIGYGLHLLLDITGHERYSTYSNLIFGLGQTTAVIIQTLFGQKKSLFSVGLGRVVFASLHLLGTILLAGWWGWLDHYNICIATISLLVRIISSDDDDDDDFPGTNLPTDLLCVNVWHVMQDIYLTSRQFLATACPLGLAYLLNYGQWEVLTLFVVALGPAEMVAWAMVGYLWSMLKYLSDGIADASESRCALHLVLNQPNLARICAGKCHFLGFFASVLTTSLLFLIGMELCKAMIPDPTLQRLMMEILPLLGIGNVVQTSSLISASILAAPERNSSSSMVILLRQWMGNWCVTMILGGIFTFGFQIDLQGIASAVVLGLGLSSTGNAYQLLRSDWDMLAMSLSNTIE